VPTLEVFGLLALIALGWLWLDSLRARDAAIVAARAACDSEGFQLLDDTVAIAGLKPSRDEESMLVLRRTYSFEYSDTGDNRRRGSIVLVGHRVLVLNIGLRVVPDDRTLH
jgi:hypothetical protein